MIYIPILHHATDLGSLSKKVEELIPDKDRAIWKKRQEDLVIQWRKIGRELKSLKLDYARVRVFQDGLPVGGELGHKIVEEVAAQGSPNYQLVREMMEQGAALEQTEDPRLLLEEYDLLSAEASCKTIASRRRLVKQHWTRHADLLPARDRFVGRRINEALREGEVGVLFMGAAHDILSHLASDIEVRQLRTGFLRPKENAEG